jgi:hypothetical protein
LTTEVGFKRIRSASVRSSGVDYTGLLVTFVLEKRARRPPVVFALVALEGSTMFDDPSIVFLNQLFDGQTEDLGHVVKTRTIIWESYFGATSATLLTLKELP